MISAVVIIWIGDIRNVAKSSAGWTTGGHDIGIKPTCNFC